VAPPRADRLTGVFMPNITFMSWNVQEFGVNRMTRGNYVPLCNLIARVAWSQGADIFALMELERDGVAHLPTLAAALNAIYGGNADWYFDWIKGAIREGIGGNPIRGAADLDWDYDHREGYAVFWNDERNADFAMIPAVLPYSSGVTSGRLAQRPNRIPPNVLSLVLQGRKAGELKEDGWFHAPDFDPNNPDYEWPGLDFLKSNTLKQGVTEVGGPRRPCFFVLNLTRNAPFNQPANCLFPMLVFHATANPRSREYDTQLGSYSRQLYQVDSTPTTQNPTYVTVDNALIAGDFNVDANNREEQSADAYKAYIYKWDYGGANCFGWLDVTVAPTAPTSVALTVSYASKEPILSDARTGYYKEAIDNIFFRMPKNQNMSVVVGPYQSVFDMVAAVMAGGALCHANMPGLIAAFAAPIDQIIDKFPEADPRSATPAVLKIKRGRDGVTVTIESILMRGIYKWPPFFGGLKNGTFPTPRTAAEFVKKFVSDHLPVTIRFTYT
jgi:hypothetical protein